jgi:inner membrane protein
MFLGFMSITHATIAAAGASLILGTAEPMALGLAVLGSQLPDLDTSESTIGKIFFPVSSWIEDRFPHRSITHSLLATGFIAALPKALAERDRPPCRLLFTLGSKNSSSPSSWSSPLLFLRYLHQAGSTIVLSRSRLGS